MNKQATTGYPIHCLIQRRWSPRSFDDRSLESEKLVQLLEAARWAPSWRNDQPWRFIVATQEDPEAYRRMFDCLKQGNQRWAGRAPVLMIAFAKKGYDHDTRTNPITLYDTGQAVAQLTIEALSQGLYVHQMGGVHHDKIRETYNLPEAYQPIVALAIGYLGEPTDLPPDLQQREEAPRSRLPLGEIAFSGAWGRPFTGEGPTNGRSTSGGPSSGGPPEGGSLVRMGKMANRQVSSRGVEQKAPDPKSVPDPRLVREWNWNPAGNPQPIPVPVPVPEPVPIPGPQGTPTPPGQDIPPFPTPFPFPAPAPPGTPAYYESGQGSESVCWTTSVVGGSIVGYVIHRIIRVVTSPVCGPAAPVCAFGP
jgi:nitroreductase